MVNKISNTALLVFSLVVSVIYCKEMWSMYKVEPTKVEVQYVGQPYAIVSESQLVCDAQLKLPSGKLTSMYLPYTAVAGCPDTITVSLNYFKRNGMPETSEHMAFVLLTLTLAVSLIIVDKTITDWRK